MLQHFIIFAPFCMPSYACAMHYVVTEVSHFLLIFIIEKTIIVVTDFERSMTKSFDSKFTEKRILGGFSSCRRAAPFRSFCFRRNFLVSNFLLQFRSYNSALWHFFANINYKKYSAFTVSISQLACSPLVRFLAVCRLRSAA